MKRKLLIAAVSLCAPILAYAGCEDYFQTWVSTLDPGRTIDASNAACKIWPANPALTLAVLPLPHKDATDDGGIDDLEVLVADSASGAVIAHGFRPSAITYDAVRLSGISLDTARYQLTPNNRAFGVRISYSGSSRVDPFDATSLSLYVVDGQALRLVLDRLAAESSTGEWDGNCAGDFSKMTRTIDIGPRRREGYAALNIAEKSTKSVNTAVKDECGSKNQSSTQTKVTLEYQNGRYAVPHGMQLD
jgi:hypothetical protein